MTDLNDLKAEYKLCGSGDAWGECMSWLFAIADYMTYERDMQTPAEWCYSSPCGPDKDAHEYQTLLSMNPDDDSLVQFGDMLWRLRSILKAKDMDY